MVRALASLPALLQLAGASLLVAAGASKADAAAIKYAVSQNGAGEVAAGGGNCEVMMPVRRVTWQEALAICAEETDRALPIIRTAKHNAALQEKLRGTYVVIHRAMMSQ